MTGQPSPANGLQRGLLNILRALTALPRQVLSSLPPLFDVELAYSADGRQVDVRPSTEEVQVRPSVNWCFSLRTLCVLACAVLSARGVART